MSTILEIDGLKIGFRKEDTVREIVHGVVIGLSAGESLALVGESGSGKTVTAQAVLRLLPETHIAYSSLTALDFLGFGLPPGSPSLGELLAQAKANLQTPWLGISAFIVLSLILSLLVFTGEAVAGRL